MFTLDGTQTIQNSAFGGSVNSVARWRLPVLAKSYSGIYPPNAICDRLKLVGGAYIGNFASWGEATAGSNGFTIRITGDLVGIGIAKSVANITSATELNAWLAENPVTIYYQLATPITIQLTPTEVKTLLGEDNVWNDTGDTTVTYKADIQKYIDKKISAVVNA